MSRRDYFYDTDAPKPNSIRPAAAVALFDSNGNILLLRRKDNDKWTMPGGTLDVGESLTHCAVREVREDTGL
jgi:8-oxo-dGTP diphosphatase